MRVRNWNKQWPTDDHPKALLERSNDTLCCSVAVFGYVVHRHTTVALLKVDIALLSYAFERSISGAKEENCSPVIAF